MNMNPTYYQEDGTLHELGSLLLAQELWEWIAQDHQREKRDWPGWKDHNDCPFDCPTCGYAGLHETDTTPEPSCDRCPLIGYNTMYACCTHGEPFFEWGAYIGNPDEREHEANRMVDLIQRSIAAVEDKGSPELKDELDNEMQMEEYGRHLS